MTRFGARLEQSHHLARDDWFGSIAPEDALTEEGINVTDERVMRLAVEASTAIEECAESLGLDAWLIVRCLLRHYCELPEA